MPPSGRVLFGQMDEVVFGKPAAEAVAAQVHRLGTTRVFLMVSNSLNRNTDEIDKVRRALGNRCAGTFDRMPAHTPRSAVIEATEAARAAQADLIVTIGGGSITDGAKAVQMCLANDIRSRRGDRHAAPRQGRRRYRRPTPNEGADGASDQRADHALGRRVQRHRRASPTSARKSRSCCAIRASCRARSCSIRRSPLHTPEWLWLSTGIRAVDHCVEGICSNEAHAYRRRAGAERTGAACERAAARQGRAEGPRRAARLPDGHMAVDGPALQRTCRWARAMASAMCSALSSTCRTGTPPASCCRRSCAGTSRSNADRQALVSAAMSQAGSDAGDVLDA